MDIEQNQVSEYDCLTQQYSFRPFTDEEQLENDLKEAAGPTFIGQP
jgi:hypothetical protein